MLDQKSDESLTVEIGSFSTSSHDRLTHLITSHKLNGQNYTQWVRLVKIFFQGEEKVAAWVEEVTYGLKKMFLFLFLSYITKQTDIQMEK